MTAPATLDQQLCFALYAATMAVQRAYKPTLDALGLTYPQYLVLLALWEEDAQSVGAIAARLTLEPSTVTPLVKRMEAAGLVARTRETRDERVVTVRLTAAGRALEERCGCVGEALVARAGMPLARLGRLNGDVRALLAALGEER